MKLQIKEFSGACISHEILDCLSDLPFYTKGSQQRGKIGHSIFDPIGTNHHLKTQLNVLGWKSLEIPKKWKGLGLEVDYYKNGTVLEAQFANYPYLFNNALRTQVLSKDGDLCIDSLAIVVKGDKIPSSNGVLYFSQAVSQLEMLFDYNALTLPISVIGLQTDDTTTVIWTKYTGSRSRIIEERIHLKEVA